MSNQTTGVAVQATKFNTVKDLLEKYKPQIATALPAHLTPDKMVRMALTAISKNPKLLDCTQTSLFGSIISLSQLGLAPDAVLGEAYLIPYGTEAQLIVGYKGLVSLARRSGEVARFQARAVHKGDEFDYEFGLDERLTHKPCVDGTDETITHVYAVIVFKDGTRMFDVMTRKQVEFARDKSKGRNNPVWKSDFGEMAKKTIIRRLSKVAPLSPEFSKAVALDEQLDVLGKSQKNEKELLNFNMPELKDEVEQSIDADYELMQEEDKDLKVEQAAAKGNAATDAALNALNKKK